MREEFGYDWMTNRWGKLLARTVDEITRKEGEAALLWFQSVLAK